MARTPLLGAFERLAREHDNAERLGITTGELRERQAEATFTGVSSSDAGAPSPPASQSRLRSSHAAPEPRQSHPRAWRSSAPESPA
jgi:hypothetical protein